MPQAAFVAIGLALESAAGAWIIANAATLASAALVVGSIAANSLMQRRAAAKARAAYNASLKDREIMIRSAVAPRRVVLGRDKISGPIVYAESTGSKGQFLHLVIALADGECEAIETIYFNDVALPAADGAGLIQSGEFCNVSKKTSSVSGAVASGGSYTLPRTATKVHGISTSYINEFSIATDVTGWSHTPGSATITGLPSGPQLDISYEYEVVKPRVRIRTHLGQAGQVADADLVAESAGDWTAAHVGTGVCYLYVRLEYDVDVFGQVGVPNISAAVKGRKLYDPRTATTVWSDNAALCAAHWLRDSAFGLGATSAEVPAAEVITAANICDELVNLDALPTQQARYTFNGSFTTEESPRDVLADLLTGMAGNCIWVQGRWLVRAGAYRTPELTLTEDHLAGSSVSIVPKASRGEVFNAVRVTYRDPSQAWAEVQAPLVTNAGYEAQDGRQIVRSVALPAAMDTLRAQRLGKIILERARQAVTLQITTNLRAYDLAPTDTVAVTLPRYGFAGKVFEVRERTWSVEGNLQYTLQETAAGVWAWAYGEATVGDLAPDTALPNPYTLPPPLENLSVESGTAHLLRMGDGTLVTRAWLQWDEATGAFVLDGGRIEAQWRVVDADDWQAAPALAGDAINAYLQPMPDGRAVLFRVRAVNAAGRASDWATVTHIIVGKTAAPSNVAGLTATIVPGGVEFHWTANADLDHAATELHVESTWNPSTPALVVARATRHLYPWPALGMLTVLAKHIDTSGNYSAAAASVTVLIDESVLIQWANTTGGNLVNAANWLIGSSGSQSGGGLTTWTALATSSGGGNDILLRASPDGTLRALWEAFSGADIGTSSEGGIGSTSQITVDSTKPYRFAVWMRNSGPLDGWVYLGIEGNKVDDVPSGVINANPYFHALGKAALLADRWYLFTGHVLPEGYAGVQPNDSAIYDGTTGERVQSGTDFRWHAGVTETSLRAFQFYTVGAGRTLQLSGPRFEQLDGNEPSTAQLIADAVRVGTSTALANIASDSILSPGEKPSVVQSYAILVAEQATLDAQATVYGITTEKTTYDSAIAALTAYLATLPGWNTMPGSDVAIVRATFNAKFQDVYTARTALQAAIAANKVRTFVQGTEPTADGVGDLWINTSSGNSWYRWSGSAWLPYLVGTAGMEDDAASALNTYYSSAGVTFGTSIYDDVCNVSYTPADYNDLLVSGGGIISLSAGGSSAGGVQVLMSTYDVAGPTHIGILLWEGTSTTNSLVATFPWVAPEHAFVPSSLASQGSSIQLKAVVTGGFSGCTGSSAENWIVVKERKK